jgi:hypothetical protein
MTPSTFSIITPHSNTSIENDQLLPTLASIADQEGASIELLLQHGGGMSGLWAKLSRALNLSTKKETITLRVIEEKSTSPEEALAAGIKRATGTWIGFLQPGEQYLPGALTALQQASEAHPDSEVFITSSVISIANKLITAPAILPTTSFLKNWEHSWPSHAIFFRSSLFKDGFLLEPRHQHQMINDALLRLLETGKKIKTLPIVTTFTALKEEKKSSLLPKPTGMTALLKPWHQWRHQAAIRQAQKAIKLPSTVSIYQNASLTQRTSIG